MGQVLHRGAVHEAAPLHAQAPAHRARADPQDPGGDVGARGGQQAGGLLVVGVGADDDGEGGQVGVLGHRPADHVGQGVRAGVVGLELGQGVHEADGGGGGQPAGAPAQPHGARAGHVRQGEGGGHGHGRLEVVARPGPAAGVQDEQVVGAAGLLELAHDEPAQAGGGGPVDVAAVVAGLVVAQRVEGHVGGGQLGGDHALDVELEAGGLEGDADGARVHVEGLGVVPGAHGYDERYI